MTSFVTGYAEADASAPFAVMCLGVRCDRIVAPGGVVVVEICALRSTQEYSGRVRIPLAAFVEIARAFVGLVEGPRGQGR